MTRTGTVPQPAAGTAALRVSRASSPAGRGGVPPPVGSASGFAGTWSQVKETFDAEQPLDLCVENLDAGRNSWLHAGRFVSK